MTRAEVVGITPDGIALVLVVAGETVEVDLDDVRRAERAAERAAERRAGLLAEAEQPLTPRRIQQRIRSGETAQEIAAGAGVPVGSVARYEGPVLAEREHQASTARRQQVEGRLVEELVAGHLGREADDLDWDAWLLDDGRWEVRANAGAQAVRLRWDPTARRVQPLDESARRALRVAGVHEDVLTAVLRPFAAPAARMTLAPALPDPMLPESMPVSTSPAAELPEPATPGPATPEPGTPEPATPEPGATEPATTEASDAEPRGPRPSAAPPPSAAPSSARPARRARAEVPMWADITSQVTGREPRP